VALYSSEVFNNYFYGMIFINIWVFAERLQWRKKKRGYIKVGRSEKGKRNTSMGT
jgi:hypothetical protein